MSDIYASVLSQPSSDFRAVQGGRVAYPDSVSIDLTTARSVAAGNAAEIVVAGNFFYSDMDPILQGGFRVHFQDTAFTPKAGMYCPPGFVSKVPFTRFLIENDAQPGKRALIFYGTDVGIDPGGSAQVSVTGSVNVIDGEQARTLANTAFIGGVQQAGAAGQGAECQLWNPVGSGKKLVLQQVSFSTNAASNLYAFWSNATFGAALPTSQSSKLQGGAASVAELHAQNTAAGPASAFWVGFTQAGGMLTWTPKGGLIIPPGEGFTVWSNTANVSLFMNPEWYEIAQ